MNALRKIFRKPWYFLTVACYPALALLLSNISEIRFVGAVRPLLVSILLAVLLFLVLRLILRQWHRAAFATTGILLLVFSYGHVFDLLKEKFERFPLDSWLWILWIGLGVVVLVWSVNKKAHFEKAVTGLNVVSLGLVLVTAFQIAWFNLPRSSAQPADENAPLQVLRVAEGTTPPDIYYIIVDSYGRSDLLERAFEYDNSAFIQNLEAMGFYVADCAQSNYNRTDVSLASSLNLGYLQDLSAEYQPPSQSRRTLWASIDLSTARLMLEDAGYTTVAFATGFAWSEVRSADVFLEPHSLAEPITSFEIMLLGTTPARYLESSGWLNFDALDGERYRERTDFIFDQMDDLANMPGPNFVFIHILPPHPPFVYGPDGSFTDPAPFLNEDERYTFESYTRGYRNQVEYISGQVEAAVRTLLEESATPPIVILQGDHAPWLQTGNGKFLVLNAYHFPGHNDVPYATISPVNTFRLIFNTYFGTDYALLEDTSYYSPIPSIYDFEEFANPCTSH